MLNIRTEIGIIRRKVVKEIPSLIDIHEISQDGHLDIRLLCQLNNNASIRKKLNMMDEKKLSCVVMYELLELSKAYPSLGEEIVPLISSDSALGVLSLVWTAVCKRKRNESCTHVKPKTFVDYSRDIIEASPPCGSQFPTAASDNTTHKTESFQGTFENKPRQSFRASKSTSQDGYSEIQKHGTEKIFSSDPSTVVVGQSGAIENSSCVDVNESGGQSTYGVGKEHIHNKAFAQPFPTGDNQQDSDGILIDDPALGEEVAIIRPCQNQKESVSTQSTEKSFSLSLQSPTKILQCAKTNSSKRENLIEGVKVVTYKDNRKSNTGEQNGINLTCEKKKVWSFSMEKISALDRKDNTNAEHNQQRSFTSSVQPDESFQVQSGSPQTYGPKCKCKKASVTCFKHLVNIKAIPEFKKGCDMRKNEFIGKWVIVERCVTQKRDRASDNRVCKRQYMLPGDNGKPVKVCKLAFLQILGICSQTVDTAVKDKSNKIKEKDKSNRIKQPAGVKKDKNEAIDNVEEISSPVEQSVLCNNTNTTDTLRNTSISINNNSWAGNANLQSGQTPTIVSVPQQNGSSCGPTLADGISSAEHLRYNHNECEISSELREDSSFSSDQQVSSHPSPLAYTSPMTFLSGMSTTTVSAPMRAVSPNRTLNTENQESALQQHCGLPSSQQNTANILQDQQGLFHVNAYTSSNNHIRVATHSLTSTATHNPKSKMPTYFSVDNARSGRSTTISTAAVNGTVSLASGSMIPAATCTSNTHMDDCSLISSPKLNSLLQQLYQNDTEPAEPQSNNNHTFANAQAPPIPTSVSATEAALETEAQKRMTDSMPTFTSLPQTPVMTADEVDKIRHDLAALGIKQSRAPHQPEDDKIDVTFINNRLQTNSKDDSQPIKRLVSSDKLRTVTDNVTPAQVHVIGTKLVNLDLCFNELFSFASKCTNCKRVLICDAMDNTSDNLGIVKGLALVLYNVHSLISIDIRDTYLGEGGRQVLSSLSCPHLRVLILIDDHLAGCGLQLAACLTRLPLLAYLNLNDSGLTGEEMSGVLDSLAVSCPQLVALLLGGHDLSQAADALARTVQAKSRLQILTISRGKLESKHLLNIVKSTSLKIEYLHIWGNAVCTEVETELVRLAEQRPSLRYVAVDKSQVRGDVWDRMESVLRGRGGHLHENIEGSDECKKDTAYLDKVHDECLIEET